MYDELFENPAVVARYRAGPYAKSREQFLKKAQANGYSPRTLMRMAWALLVVAEIVRDAGGSITSERLRSALYRRVKSKWAGHPPSRHTIKLILQAGVPWLRNLGGLIVEPNRPQRFATELLAFNNYCRVERGLSPVTITSCDEAMRWFFKSLPSRVRSLDTVTLAHIDAFLKDHASRGWSRKSLHALACKLRSFFRTPGVGNGVDPISRAVSSCRASINLRMFRGLQALNRSIDFSKALRPATTL